jgi:hypothetical protein
MGVRTEPFHFTSAYVVIVDPTEVEVGDELVVQLKDGTHKLVIVDAMQMFTGRNGKLRGRCLVSDVN